MYTFLKSSETNIHSPTVLSNLDFFSQTRIIVNLMNFDIFIVSAT